MCRQIILSFLRPWKSDLCDRPHFHFFQGLDLLRRASSLKEEVQQLETEGLLKIELAVEGSEAEGLYRLLRAALSHSPMSSIPHPPAKCCHTPSTTISKSPLRSLKKLHMKPPLLWLEGSNWHQKLPPQLYPKLWRWPSLPT